MIIEYLYVPGVVLGAWDTLLNKANPNLYSLGNYMLVWGER